MEPGESNLLVVDFMSLLRSIPIDQLSRLQDLLNATWKHIKGMCKFKQIGAINDDCVDDLLKSAKDLAIEM